MSAPAGSGQARYSSWSIAWLIAALILLSLTASLLAFHAPDDSQAIRDPLCEARHADGTPARPAHRLTLPYAAPAADSQAGYVTACRIDIPLSADALHGTALFIPSFIDSVAIAVNGRRVALAELYLMRNLRFATLPAFVPLPAGVLREGVNTVEIQLWARPGRRASLDRIFIGNEAALRPYFHARWFASAVLPTLVVGAGLALALVFAVLWTARPREREFGWLSAALLLGALRGSVLIPDFGLNLSDRPLWNIFVAWETTAILMFCRAVARAPRRRGEWLWAVPPLALTLVFAFGATEAVADGVIRTTMALIFVQLLAALWILGRAAVRGNQEALIVLLGLAMLFAFVVRDFVMVLFPGPNLIFLARAVYGGFLAAVTLLMILRFVRAMRELDNTSDVLRERIAATQAELHKTYGELRARREAEAIERERNRLMCDLHDGLGGDLVSMLALAESPQPRPEEIARHARSALTDMRLIISSLEDYGGNLLLTLGTWRERADPQLRAAGLRLVWAVRDVPVLSGLGPAQILDILRILQEAVTNIIRHADARTVTIETFDTEQGTVLAISDDGTGRAATPGTSGGHGIGNMRLRARRLGAHLDITRSAQGTRVTLRLPRQFA
ncbi:sensor histidine kinase [Pigmentiphaga humi]|uniref:sensor histidine kinase n=1 Tax=Pigmentiphaga humi TaxID=2478468 RepID=UPI001358BA4A|nr:ATP-binding protein [Pigmentiphaga humi]